MLGSVIANGRAAGTAQKDRDPAKAIVAMITAQSTKWWMEIRAREAIAAVGEGAVDQDFNGGEDERNFEKKYQQCRLVFIYIKGKEIPTVNAGLS